MQQRRPRLGDVLDDYCPRERRVTNHVVVAMIEDEVKQTRCSTCDADHEYKQARVPSPRRPKSVAALHDGAESFEGKPVLAPPPRVDAESEAASESESDDAPSSPQSEPVAAVPVDGAVPMAASADASAQLRHFYASASQTGQEVLQLCQFHLQLTFPGARVTGKDVENQLRAVNNPALNLAFDVALL